MPTRPVSIVRCESYKQEQVSQAITRACELCSAGSLTACKDKNVLLKINLLNGTRPDTATNTHVEFTRAVVRVMKQYGAKVTISDSSGPLKDTKDCFDSSGYSAMSKAEDVELLPLSASGYQEVPIPGGKRIHSALVARLLLEAELVVSLPKLKTHVQTAFTGAVKNFFGALPFSERRRLHRLATYEAFSESIVDLYSAVGRGMCLMDAIVGMQGTGPSSGSPARIGLVLASENGANLDVAATEIVGLSAGRVHTVKDTIARGLASSSEHLRVVGEDLSEVRRDFKIPPRLLLRANPLIERLTDLFLGVHKSAVVVDEKRCEACGHCQDICPVGAIRIDKYCRIDYEKCIKCFCCFEICPYGAIDLKKTVWARIWDSLRGNRKENGTAD